MNAKEVIGAFFIFLVCVLLGVVICFGLVFTSVFFSGIELLVIAGVLLFGGVGLLCFFSLKFLAVDKVNILILTLGMSLLVCFGAYTAADSANGFRTALSDFVNQQVTSALPPLPDDVDPSVVGVSDGTNATEDIFGLSEIIHEPISAGLLMILIVIGYNVFALFNVFFHTEEP